MGSEIRVLMIEDSVVLRRLIQTCFRDFDAVFEAQRLPHSPQRLGGFSEADLVIIGMYQPFAVGLRIVERLQARAEPPAIVAITTDTRERSIQEILESGADVAVKMPFRPEELRKAATRALNGRSYP